jgi:glycosyltransferase involved in cell wall biosynthesis
MLFRSSLPTKAKIAVVDSTQIAVPPPGFNVRMLRAAVRAVRFLVRYEANRPVAVLIFSSSGASFVEKCLYAAYSRLRGSRVLFFLRDGGFMVIARRSAAYRTYARQMLRASHVVLCQSASWRQFFATEIGVDVNRCAIVENWTVSRSDLAIGDERDYQRTTTLKIGYLGWIEETKGIMDLLEALRLLVSGCPVSSLELIVAGQGTALAKCERFVRANGIASNVTFLGWVSGEQKAKFLREVNIFVLPSHFEGISNAMLEAMAAGLPVVVTRVGGLPDVVQDGCDGLVVEPGDPLALRDAISTLAGDPNLRESLGRAARAKAERFDVERAVDQLLALAAPSPPIPRVADRPAGDPGPGGLSK